MIKLAYLLLIFSVIGGLLIFNTFFLEFKYLPLNSTKMIFLIAFSYLGYKSYLWIKALKEDSKKNKED